MKHLACLLACVLLPAVAPAADQAANPCDAFEWNVTAERALFAGPANDVVTGADADKPVVLELAHAYRSALHPQADVHFAESPAKRVLAEGLFAGLATIHIAQAGRYRVSLDAPAWIDAVQAGAIIPSRAFQGRQGCSAPHKVVEYELQAGDVLLQLSAAPSASLRLVATASPTGS
jgi:hypothetical protein